MAERHARILAELAELGMGFARDARRDAEAAETPEERARAALVFQRVSRSIRQSLALEAKLVREARRDAGDLAREEAQRRREQVDARRRRLRERTDALVWHETENMDEAEEDAFDDEIDEAVNAELDLATFLTDPFDDQMGRIVARLGFEITPEGRARRIPEPGPEPGREPGPEPGSGPAPEPAFHDSA